MGKKSWTSVSKVTLGPPLSRINGRTLPAGVRDGAFAKGVRERINVLRHVIILGPTV